MIIKAVIIALTCLDTVCYSDEITYGNDLIIVLETINKNQLVVKSSDTKSCIFQNGVFICPLKNVIYSNKVFKINEIIYEDSFTLQEEM